MLILCRAVQHFVVGMQSTNFENKEAVVKLWTHEMLRAFGDRLSRENDLSEFIDSLQSTAEKYFYCKVDGV